MAACHADTVITMSVYGLPTTYEDGSYNGFAFATIDGVSNQWIICDDAADVTYVPSGNMLYDESTVGGSDPLQSARFTQGPEVQNYDEAAVLVWELDGAVLSGGSQDSADAITDYQYALWNLFDPYNATTNPNGIATTSSQAALQAAALNLVKTEGAMLSTTVYPYVNVFTPDPNGGSMGNQEFLQFSTPEPGTFLLFAGGLLVAAAAKLRRGLGKRPGA
jgi:hypothetical protein